MSTNKVGMISGVTLAALGAMLLFALTTIAVGIWGGMQYQALQALRTEYAALEQRSTTHNAEADQVTAQSTPMPPAVPQPPPQMQPPPPTKEQRQQRQSMIDAMDKMKEFLQSDEVHNSKINHDMVFMYGEFLDQYGLTPEKRAQVEVLLRAHMAELGFSGIPLYGIQVPLDGKSDEQTLANQDVVIAALNKILRDQLSQVLSPRELADWDQYEATRDQRIIIKELDMGFHMATSSMSSEGRTIARDVLAEELIAAIQRGKGPNSSVGTRIPWAQRIAAEVEAVHITRDRLATTLSPGDMQTFDRFANNVLEQQEMIDRITSRQKLLPPLPQLQP